MAKSKSKETILRKKEKVVGDLTKSQKFDILWMYAHNKSYDDICSTFNVSKRRLIKWIGDFNKAIRVRQG